jgi:hypothetical protein
MRSQCHDFKGLFCARKGFNSLKSCFGVKVMDHGLRLGMKLSLQTKF